MHLSSVLFLFTLDLQIPFVSAGWREKGTRQKTTLPAYPFVLNFALFLDVAGRGAPSTGGGVTGQQRDGKVPEFSSSKDQQRNKPQTSNVNVSKLAKCHLDLSRDQEG